MKKTNYDLIFMDIMMPVMDGIEAFQNLKKIKDFHTPVITLTADNENNAHDRYLSLGFNDYLIKPIMKEDMKIIVEKYQ